MIENIHALHGIDDPDAQLTVIFPGFQECAYALQGLFSKSLSGIGDDDLQFSILFISADDNVYSLLSLTAYLMLFSTKVCRIKGGISTSLTECSHST